MRPTTRERCTHGERQCRIALDSTSFGRQLSEASRRSDRKLPKAPMGRQATFEPNPISGRHEATMSVIHGQRVPRLRRTGTGRRWVTRCFISPAACSSDSIPARQRRSNSAGAMYRSGRGGYNFELRRSRRSGKSAVQRSLNFGDGCIVRGNSTIASCRCPRSCCSRSTGTASSRWRARHARCSVVCVSAL